MAVCCFIVSEADFRVRVAGDAFVAAVFRESLEVDVFVAGEDCVDRVLSDDVFDFAA